MILSDIVEGLGLRVLTSRDIADVRVTGGYTCDLLSDVMGNARTGDLWITLQTHQNIVAVAKLRELAGIIIVNDRRPAEETIPKADEENITICTTKESAFSISGRLHRMLVKS